MSENPIKEIVILSDCSKAYKELNWKAELDLNDMVSSSYHFAKNKK